MSSVNSELVTDPQEIASAFNEYYHSTFTRSDYTLPPLDSLPAPSSYLDSIVLEETEVLIQLKLWDVTV